MKIGGKKIRLEIKIVALLAVIIAIIILFYSVILSRHYQEYEDQVVGQENLNTLHSMEASIETLIKSANDYSKMLIADSTIQRQMEKGDLFLNVSEQHILIKRIYSVLQFSDSVEAVWLIDQKGQKLSVAGSATISYEDNNNLDDSYKQYQSIYGRAHLVFQKENKENKLSLVRSYNSLDHFISLGVIGVDIKRQEIDKIISGIIDLNKEKILMLDEHGEVFFAGGQGLADKFLYEIADELNKKQYEALKIVNVEGKRYYLSGIYNNESKRRIIRCTQIQKSNNEIVQFMLALIVLIGITIFCGATIISRMLTKPIQLLLDCMKNVNQGQFPRIEEHQSHLEEFGTLYKGYNHMVEQIERLFQETIDRQRRIRQVELNEIQEQMKPHFLYNTLDSVEALALMGDTQKVCMLIETLGDFYRKSVSGGKEFLSIRDEMKIAEDYMEIMKIRFEDSFQCEIQCDASCEDFMLPKLTIQPLVENAFQYGVRGKKAHGIIDVFCRKEGDQIHICVCDNGEGVPDDVIEEIMSNEEPRRGKSLGLRGTIERLRLIYGNGFSYEIKNGEMSEIHFYLCQSASD